MRYEPPYAFRVILYTWMKLLPLLFLRIPEQHSLYIYRMWIEWMVRILDLDGCKILESKTLTYFKGSLSQKQTPCFRNMLWDWKTDP